MRTRRHGFILLVLACLLILLSAPATGKIIIDMPFLGPQQLPVDIPFLETSRSGHQRLHRPITSTMGGNTR